MASGSEHLAPGLHDYLVGHSTPPDALLRDLIAETAERFPGRVVYQIGPEQGTFMTMLTGLMGARHAIEVGTFTGYSSICLARGMAADGKLICCDISEEWTSLDLAFIDADKTGYAGYWEELVPRTRPGGVILVDNTLLHGRIFHAEPDPDALAVRQFNELVLADDRVVVAMLPVGDGLTVARKK